MSISEIKQDLIHLAAQLYQAGEDFKKHSRKITRLIKSISETTQPTVVLSQYKDEVLAKISVLQIYQNQTAKRACKVFNKRYLRENFTVADILHDLRWYSQWYLADKEVVHTLRTMPKNTKPAEIFQLCRERIFNEVDIAKFEMSIVYVKEFLLKYPEADTHVVLGKYSVSKLLLCAQSPVIKEMFTEDINMLTPIFEHNDVIEVFYRFICTEQLAPMHVDTFLEVVEFAHQYNCDLLEARCAEHFPLYITTLTDKEQIWGIWKIAKKRHLGWLQVQLLRYFVSHPDLIPNQLQDQARLFSGISKCFQTHRNEVFTVIFNPEQKTAVLRLGISCSELEVCAPMTADEITTISKFSTLRKVRVVNISPEMLAELNKITSINDLKVVMYTNFQENSAALKELLAENCNLKNFEISISSESVKVDLNELVDALCGNTALRQLGVSATIDSDMAKAFITVLQRNQTLKILNLRNSVIPRAIAQQLLDADIRVVIGDDDIHL